MRNIHITESFKEFYEKLDEKTKIKTKYCLELLKGATIINSNLVKKLKNTEFYELRIKVRNEYRVILFAADHENIIEAKEVFILNGFIKKSTKDYRKQIRIAESIIKQS